MKEYMKDIEIFLSDEERGIDPTCMPANDCGRVQNSPKREEIMAWWIEEFQDTGESPEVLDEWLRQLAAGEAFLTR
ncbi:MAG: hypothetical protein A3J60_02875 [Candidatus Pacebacteria bacterium RIFCSPHIGHO2_02_FULL_46_9]|nr:MAG: hypothetical protein A3J60_02875 [Candidatus Pacebacteria bacterium RIFCSPHIGHO2_02_FULL_46_9]